MSDSNFSAIRARLKYESIEEFIAGYARFISAGGMFIPMAPAKLKSTGTTIRFQFLLGDGTTALLGEGIVVQVRPPEEGNPKAPVGMLIKFSKLSQESKNLVDQIVAMKEFGSLGPAADAEQEPDEPAAPEEDEDATMLVDASGHQAAAEAEADDPTYEMNLNDFMALQQEADAADQHGGLSEETAPHVEPESEPEAEPEVAEIEPEAEPEIDVDVEEPQPEEPGTTRGPRQLGQTEGGLQILAFDDMSDEEAHDLEFDLGADESDIDEMFAGLFGGSDADDDMFGGVFGGDDPAGEEMSVEEESEPALEEASEPALEEQSEPEQAFDESEPALAVESELVLEEELAADFEPEQESEPALEEESAPELAEESSEPELAEASSEPELAEASSEPVEELAEESEESEPEVEDEAEFDEESEPELEAAEFGDEEEEDEADLAEESDEDEDLDEVAEEPEEDLVEEEQEPLPLPTFGDGEGASLTFPDDWSEAESDSEADVEEDDHLSADDAFADESEALAEESAAEELLLESDAVELIEGSEAEFLLEEVSEIPGDSDAESDDPPMETFDEFSDFEAPAAETPSSELELAEDDGPSELENLLGNLESDPAEDHNMDIHLQNDPLAAFEEPESVEPEPMDDDDEESLDFLLAAANAEIAAKQADAPDDDDESDILDELLGDVANLPPPPADDPVFGAGQAEAPKKKKGFLSKLFGKD